MEALTHTTTHRYLPKLAKLPLWWTIRDRERTTQRRSIQCNGMKWCGVGCCFNESESASIVIHWRACRCSDSQRLLWWQRWRFNDMTFIYSSINSSTIWINFPYIIYHPLFQWTRNAKIEKYIANNNWQTKGGVVIKNYYLFGNK